MVRLLLVVMLLVPVCSVAREAPAHIDGAMTVDLFQARHLYEMGAVFIDVRSDDKWHWGHIKGAVHLNFHRDLHDLARSEWPRDLPIVIYCDSEICSSGPAAVANVVDWGYSRVFYFRGGYFAWQLADFPLGKGLTDELAGLKAQVR
ncbi:rhodanese-like domain-containing protein [Stutzerimonas tarimensis]|uniref:Rhodanese-like domain-containing protein n=1 Tax=Stutzerimonas tarimensis TaxID=1507735 RepID=A0ABV7TAM6_9GAMM